MDDSSQLLLARWRQGDQEAASVLFHRYFQNLMRLVRGRLSTKLASRLDAEDVVQSAYRSFFSVVREEEIVLECSGDLWRLLVTMTMHELLHQVRRENAGRRSIQREQLASGTAAWFEMDREALSREPSPDQAAMVVDEVERIMRDLDPLRRRVVEMRLQGYSTSEIANDVDRSDRTVRLIMEEVRGDLSGRLEAYGA